MLNFNIIDKGDLNFRCVLGEQCYFDFTVYQRELFGYEHCFGLLSTSIGTKVKDLKENKIIGDVAGVRYIRDDDSVWILIRNRTYGELYKKNLGG